MVETHHFKEIDQAILDHIRNRKTAYTMKITHPRSGKAHQDPADLIIAAIAQIHQFTIVTSDEVLLAANSLKTLSTR